MPAADNCLAQTCAIIGLDHVQMIDMLAVRHFGWQSQSGVDRPLYRFAAALRCSFQESRWRTLTERKF